MIVGTAVPINLVGTTPATAVVSTTLAGTAVPTSLVETTTLAITVVPTTIV